MQVNVVNNSNNSLPEYASKGDAGCDVRAELSKINPKFLFGSDIVPCENGSSSIVINPGGRALIPTGIHTAIPKGYEIQVRPRSGLALKHGVSICNSPGTIDETYKNDIGVILINHGTEPFIVNQGDRIAQFVLNKVEQIEWNVVNNLEGEDRGGGFGHSGVK